MSLECLISFQDKNHADGKNSTFPVLQNIYNATESLDLLQILCEVMSYHEEVKKKKKKAGEVAEEPIDKTPEIIRYQSMQALANFAKAVYNHEDVNEDLIKAFASIPTLLQTLCKTLFFLHPGLTMAPPEDRPQIVKGCKWVMQSLIIALRHGVNMVHAFLSYEGILSLLQDMWIEPQLTQSALSIVQYLSSHPKGLEVVQDADIAQNILCVFEKSCGMSVAPDEGVPPVAAAAAPASKGKAAKGALPPKSESPRKEEAVEPPNYVALVALGVKYFTALAQNAKSAVAPADVSRIVKALGPILVKQEVVNKCNETHPIRQDPDLRQFVRESCILLGSYGLIREDVRAVAARETGAVRLLLTLLEKSCAVFGAGVMETVQAVPAKGGKGVPVPPPPQEPVEATPEVMRDVYTLRHVCEKALLHLLASPDSGVIPQSHNRWPSCYASHMDWDAMRSVLNLAEGSPEVSNASVIVDLIKNSDEDISNRGIRLLSVAVHSARVVAEEEQVEAFTALEMLGLDTAVVKNLSDILLLRVASASKEIDDAAGASTSAEEPSVAADQALAGEGLEEVKEGEGEVGGTNLAEKYAFEAAPASLERNASVVKISLLSAKEALSHALCSLKYFLADKDAHVSTFATKDQISGLAGLIYRCGPVAGPYLSAGESLHSVVECTAPLCDPRSFGWDLAMDSTKPNPDEVIIREIVFDALTVVAEADSKYRQYGDDAELPQKAGVQFPESTSVCAEQSMHVFRSCSNPCVATLMSRSTFKLDGDHINAAPSTQCSQDTDALCKPVCEAALRLLIAMGTSGVRGMGALYTAINQKAYEKEPDVAAACVPAMAHLKDFFCHKVLSIQPVDKEPSNDGEDPPSQTLESIDAPVSWKVPEFCELEMIEHKSPTHYLQVLHRKDLWPYLTVCGALLGVLANPQTNSTTMELAIHAVFAFSRVSNIQNEIQPAIADTFSGCFLGMGGAVVLSGCLGRFGPLSQNEGLREVLSYLINRGKSRESFWEEWAEAHPPEVDSGAKGAKGGKGGKDVKGAAPPTKKDPKKGGPPVAAAEPEIILPFLPDDSHPDPNHGPDAATWRSLINVCCDDLHGSSMKSHPLIASIQGGLSVIALELIAAGALVNQGDEGGVAPLQHTLVLGDEIVSAALIQAGADVDYVDASGNEAVKYTFFSLHTSTLSQVFDFCIRNRHANTDDKKMSLLGSSRFVTEMIAAGVDLNVCDSIDGNYPLHHALGVGQLSYVIGGVTLLIRGSEHINDKEISAGLIEQLVAGGAPINAVNHNSVAPLHILAALCDVNAVNIVLKLGATPNVMDKMGYMPIHYAVASCGAHSIATVDSLLKKSVLRPSFRPAFDNIRTGKSPDEKYDIDSKKVLEAALLEAYCPQAVKHRRLTKNDILNSRSDEGVSALMLSLCGSVLGVAPHHSILVTNPTTTSETRVRMFCYLSQLYDGNSADLMKPGESDKLTTAHAFSLLLAEEGIVNGSQSADSLFNAILNIADSCFGDESYSGDTVCSLPVLTLGIPKDWTVLHAAIVSNSESFLNYIWGLRVTLFKFPYVHFVASNPNLSEATISSVVMRAALTPVHGSLLNAALTVYPTPPIHIAVKCRNVEFLKCMCALPQCDPNVVDKAGRTAIHVACLANDVDLALLFLDYSDAVDILQKDNAGETCVDVAVKSKNVALLNALLSVKRMEVLEHLLAVDESSPNKESILMRVERENIFLCGMLGIAAPVVQTDTTVDVETTTEDAVPVERKESDLPPILSETDDGPTAVDMCGTSDDSQRCAEEVARETFARTYDNPEEELEKSDALLQEVILLLQDLNIADADVHAHKCFHDGILYREFCSRAPNDELHEEIPVFNDLEGGLGIEGSVVLGEEEDGQVFVDDGNVQEA